MKITKPTDENTEGPPQPEAKPLFLIDDPPDIYNVDDLEFIIRTLFLGIYNVDGLEFIIRTLYLAPLLEGHDYIISSIVQHRMDTIVATTKSLYHLSLVLLGYDL